MSEALYTALYVEQAPFQWIHFTKYGTVKGSLSLAGLGINLNSPTTI